jgi:hypothetical protein
MSHNLPRRKCSHIFVVLYYVKLKDDSREQNPFYGTFVSMRICLFVLAEPAMPLLDSSHKQREQVVQCLFMDFLEVLASLGAGCLSCG